MKKCYLCGAKLEESVDLLVHNGKTIPQRMQKCTKCGKSLVHIDEYEKVRSQLHPNFAKRIKRIFSPNTEFVDILKGKLL